MRLVMSRPARGRMPASPAPVLPASRRLIERLEREDAAFPAGAAALLRDPAEIRRRAQLLLARARDGGSAHFTVADGALDRLADRLATTLRTQGFSGMRAGVPGLGFWRDVEAGGGELRAWLADRLPGPVDPALRARMEVDLAVVAALIGPSPGPAWCYDDARSGLRLHGGPALAVATLQAFASGLFSSDPARPLRADAIGLRHVDAQQLGQALGCRPGRELPRLDTRAALLRRLGETLALQPSPFGPCARPAGLFDLLAAAEEDGPAQADRIDASDMLHAILATLAPVWLGPTEIGGQPLGDCWRLLAASGPGLSDGWMPLHTLAQWLAYSLVDPFRQAGVRVAGIDALTALAGSAPNAG